MADDKKLQVVKPAPNKVKCKFCGEEIPKGMRVKWLESFRRYAHIECANEHWEDIYRQEVKFLQKAEKEAKKQQKQQEAPVTDRINDLCHSVFRDGYSKKIITAELKRLTADGKSLDMVYNVLYDWYINKKKDPEPAHGRLGIVDYIYDDYAKLYAEKEHVRQSLNGAKDPMTHSVTVSRSSFAPRIKLYELS